MKLAIRRIGLKPLGKLGCVLGIVLACLPSLLCGVLGIGIVQVLRRWLEGWQEIRIELLGREIATFDLVQKLGLTEFLHRLQIIGGASWLAVALVVLVLGLLAGLVLASLTILAGMVYNMLASATGGVVVDAAVLEVRPAEISEPQLAIPRLQSRATRRHKSDSP